MRVLLADGNRQTVRNLVRLLERFGHEVETASDGLECIAKLDRFLPQIVLLDQGLLWGGADGVLEWVRDHPFLQKTLVVLTVSGELSYAFRGNTQFPILNFSNSLYEADAKRIGELLLQGDGVRCEDPQVGWMNQNYRGNRFVDSGTSAG